jgi:hypothetical protein
MRLNQYFEWIESKKKIISSARFVSRNDGYIFFFSFNFLPFNILIFITTLKLSIECN